MGMGFWIWMMIANSHLTKEEKMAKKNIDRLKNADEYGIARFLVKLFNELKRPMPLNICDKCNPATCPFSETDFMLAWLNSESVKVK